MHRAGIADAFAEVAIARVVCEALESVLNGLGKRGFINVRVLWLLAGEFCIEVGDVQNRFLCCRTVNLCEIMYTQEPGYAQRWA